MMRHIIFSWLMVIAYTAQAQINAPTVPSPLLGEQIVTIKKGSGLFSVELETTIFKPDGNGPFPVVIINHGKEFGDARFQARYRPVGAARFFLSRGYVVVVPMRQGFSKSTGTEAGGICNAAGNGLAQADDVIATIDYLKTQAYADTARIVVAGQSHGGLTTMAFGTHNHPSVLGLINFAGGIRYTGSCQWEHNLTHAFERYGAISKQPSLWFYGDNDSFWQPWLYKKMHELYVAKGGKATLIAFGNFGSDAHAMFGSKDGEPIWQPEVTKFLASLGIPSEVNPAYAKFATAQDAGMQKPTATHFAPLEDETKVPYISEARRVTYKEYLGKPMPRAFAIAPNGSLGWAFGGDDPLRRALAFCNTRGNGECKLYSVDNEVVWLEAEKKQ
jgi:dienelactone hydrolase